MLRGSEVQRSVRPLISATSQQREQEMHTGPSERLTNIALLIDCENAKPDSIDGILSELAERGTINIRRAYGDWKNQGGWEQKLHPFSIQPIQQFAYTKGKN